MYRLVRAVLFASCCLWLAGCQTDGLFTSLDKPATSTDQPPGSEAMASATPSDVAPAATNAGLLGSEQNDDLALGKKSYRSGDYGLAEQHFRRAAELHPRDAEAWVGLAASYDRLRRFDLADRAYNQATNLVGPTVEILNNQGYSYILRGDYTSARQKLLVAQAKAPTNPYVRNNLALLASSERRAKTVE